MSQPVFRHLILLIALSLGLASVIKGQPEVTDEIEQALTTIGSGSVDEIKGRLFTDRITFYSPEHRGQSVEALPKTILSYRILQGKLLRRVETMLGQMLQLHGRTGKVELLLYRDDVPFAMLWRGGVLVVSDGLAEPLYDGELAGIIAHELGHSYFEDEMTLTSRAKDMRAMRIVELKCDAVAIVSMKLLGYDPAHYLRGLQRIQLIKRRKSLSGGITQSHPEPAARARFSQRLINLLG